MDVSTLPENIRIELSDEHRKELWEEIGRQGGINAFCEEFDYSSSKMYNWKNKDSFLPVKLVRQIFVDQNIGVRAVKGEGRSGVVQDPDFKFPAIDELLTRIDISVSVNRKGSPMYQTDDIGNAERFAELLQRIGDVPYQIYSRDSYYQINYPKFLHTILVEKEFEKDTEALVDEKAEIRDEFFVLDGREIKISEFKGELYSREKSARLAMERGDTEKLQRLISMEARKAEKLLD